MTPPRRLALIVPCHNESANIRPFYDATRPVLDRLGVSWTIVYVNDASTDDTLDRILALREEDARVRVASLTRNFGYHSALVAGLSNADADLYAIIDVDGEDPPELLEAFHAEIDAGAQTVYGIRSQRPEPAHIVFFRWLFYWINTRIADGPIRLWMAEFSMFTRTVRDYILANRTTFPFLRAEMAYVGLSMRGIEYVRRPRLRGVSHYNFLRMSQFAIGGFLASSTFPLRATLYLSAAVMSAFLLYLAAARPALHDAAAWAALAGFLLVAVDLPILSLYMARAYKNITGRPVYFLDPTKSRLG